MPLLKTAPKQATLKNLANVIAVTLLSISMHTQADVKISNLDDFNLGIYSGFGNITSDDNVCINAVPVEEYQITFWGSGPAGAFEISNGVNTLEYAIGFNDRARTSGANRATPGVPMQRQRRASNQIDCPNGLNANIQIRLRRQDLQAANPGRYIGLLTVTISPE